MFNILPISQTGFHWHMIGLNLICELNVCEFSISVQGSPPPYFLHLQDKRLQCLNQLQLNRPYNCKSCIQNIQNLEMPSATVPDEKNKLTYLGL